MAGVIPWCELFEFDYEVQLFLGPLERTRLRAIFLYIRRGNHNWKSEPSAG